MEAYPPYKWNEFKIYYMFSNIQSVLHHSNSCLSLHAWLHWAGKKFWIGIVLLELGIMNWVICSILDYYAAK